MDDWIKGGSPSISAGRWMRLSGSAHPSPPPLPDPAGPAQVPSPHPKWDFAPEKVQGGRRMTNDGGAASAGRSFIHLPARRCGRCRRGPSLTVTATCRVLKTPRRGTGRSFVFISTGRRCGGGSEPLLAPGAALTPRFPSPGDTGDLLLPSEERGAGCPPSTALEKPSRGAGQVLAHPERARICLFPLLRLDVVAPGLCRARDALSPHQQKFGSSC